MKTFIAYGILITALFFAAGTRGFVVTSLMQHVKWASSGHGMYHK